LRLIALNKKLIKIQSEHLNIIISIPFLKMHRARLNKEYKDIIYALEKSQNKETKETIVAVKLVNDSLYHWDVLMRGPDKSPFEGGIYKLDVKFPNDYPFHPPTITFQTKVYHPNINDIGHICLDILKDQWSAAFTLDKVMLSISSLLTDPNPRDPLAADVARVYKEDREKYDKTVREYVKLYCQDLSTVKSK
jgi:ubiquitin-conjugating enzyme E2 D/E